VAQWFLQKQIDEISAEIRALRASVYNVDGAIDESNPLAVKAKALETKLDDLQLLLQSGDAKVQLSGTTVEIGGTTFECDPPRTIYGLESERPSASAAHAAVPYAYYVAVDTGGVTQTDGSNWGDVL